MITRKAKRKTRREASKYLEALMGGPLTLGAALSGLREADEHSLAEFAKALGVSRSHLCIRCTDRVFRNHGGDGRLASWKRRLLQRDGACSCEAGGIVRGPTSLASSTGSRQARVAAQYLGASSR
jgi:hypothetical protein